MSNIRLLSVVGLCGVSVSVGAFIGTKYEKLLKTIGTDKSNLKLVESKYYLPAVFASSHPTTTSTNSSTAIIPQSQPVNRVSEIMKFGYPSLDNVRSYDNFIISYDRRTRNPYWVFEHIRPEHVTKNDNTHRSKSNFVSDNSIHLFFRATNGDFKNSGYDRGHLAAAANHRHSQKAMDQTFILSNISPQVLYKGIYRGLGH